MTRRDELLENATVFDFFAVMRELERGAPDKPRIGHDARKRDEIVSLGQDPFLEYPLSTIERFTVRRNVPHIDTRFLGFFGPQGALPLTTTIDAHTWAVRDPSFIRFTELFSNRFLQLFFRAHADARAIAQHDRPDDDRFMRYLGSFIGIGTDATAKLDAIPDAAKMAFAGLANGGVKTATKLRQFLKGLLGTEIEVEERVGSWLTFEDSQQSTLGMAGMRLGVDTYLGSRAFTINEKIRIRLTTETLPHYRRLLPQGDLCERLTDLYFLYVGHRFDFDVELGIRAEEAPAVTLGQAGQLGLTSWIDPQSRARQGEAYFFDARFAPLAARMAPKEDATPAHQ